MNVVVSAVTPILITALIGYVLARIKRAPDSEAVRFIVAQIATPCLVFSALAKIQLSGDVILLYVVAALACVVSYWPLSWALLRTVGLPTRTYLQPLMFGNVGNLGLPLSLYAFGQTGLGFASIIFVIHSVGNFTVGQAIPAGRANWTRVLASPNLYAAILGIGAVELHVPFPGWLMNTLQLLGSLVVPMMLLMLGASLASIKVMNISRAFGLGVFRLAMGTTVGWAMSAAFGFTGVPRDVLILLSASPPAVYNYLFAVIWKTDPEEVASLIMVATLLAAVWIPILLAVLVS